MHYDNGMDTQPGEDLTLGDQYLGPASYDVDGDGVADSYIQVVGDEEIEVLTDSDGDGYVDTSYQIEADGSVTKLEDHNGQIVTVGTGHVDQSGRIQMDGSGSPGGADDGPMVTDVGQPSADIVLTDAGGSIEVGVPTIDLTGDGVSDTVQVAGTDGSTLLVADADQDGRADNVVQINPDGSVVYAVPDGRGGWVVSGTGHVNADGSLAQDPGAETGAPYDPPIDRGQPSTTADGQVDGTDAPAGGPGTDLTVDIGGKTYDVGEPTLDSDGSGAPDTAVVRGDDGTTVLVTDVDGNGTGDQIVQVNPDGSALVKRADGSGGWTTVATGHVGPDGTLVIDQR